jgi:hypothetical protein
MPRSIRANEPLKICISRKLKLPAILDNSSHSLVMEQRKVQEGKGKEEGR